VKRCWYPAAGGVGQIAAQIGLIDACRVIASLVDREMRFLRETLGLHGVIDYRRKMI